MLVLTGSVRCTQAEVVQSIQKLFVVVLLSIRSIRVTEWYVLLVLRGRGDERMVEMIPSRELIVYFGHVMGVVEKVPMSELRVILSVARRKVEVVWWSLVSLRVGRQRPS